MAHLELAVPISLGGSSLGVSTKQGLYYLGFIYDQDMKASDFWKLSV